MVLFDCELNWRYLENEKLTCTERNRLLDAALIRADHAARALDISKIQEAPSLKDAGNELGAQLNEIAKGLGGNALSIWFTNARIDTDLPDVSQTRKEQRELLSPLAPEGYRDQTVAEYQVFLENYQDRFDPKVQEAMESTANKTVYETYLELHGYPTYKNGTSFDLSLMPAWTMRGRIYYEYRLDWKTVDPSHITVGERHDAIGKMLAHIEGAAADTAWEAKDWKAFDKALKERLLMLAQEESTPALTFTVSEMRLDLAPLATEEYAHSSPQSALKAFMTACSDKDTAQMAAICVPIGTDAKGAEMLAAREAKLKFLAEMHPGYWTLGEARKEPGKNDIVIVDLTFDKGLPDGTIAPGIVSRQARLKQIDGKWYLMLESLQL